MNLSKHDDICDALGLIGQMFTTLLVGQRAKPKKKVPDSGYKPFASQTELEVYRSGGDDGWTQALMDEIGDEKFNWKTL